MGKYLQSCLICCVVAQLFACGGGSSTDTSVPVRPPTPSAQPQPIQEPQDNTPVVSIDNATLSDFQRIAYSNSASTTADLYLPLNQSGPYPVVVLIHGGCWLGDIDGDILDKRQTTEMAEALVISGVAVWNIDYRKIDIDGEWPRAFVSVGDALNALKRFPDDIPLDLTKVVIVGHSSGGHMALWAAGRHRIGSSSSIFVNNYLPIKGVLALAPVTDLRQSNACGFALEYLIGLNDMQRSTPSFSATRLSNTSPIDMLPIGVDTILATGTLDNIVPIREAERYVMEAIQAGDTSEFVPLPMTDHFGVISPQDNNWPMIESLIFELLQR